MICQIRLFVCIQLHLQQTLGDPVCVLSLQHETQHQVIEPEEWIFTLFRTIMLKCMEV